MQMLADLVAEGDMSNYLQDLPPFAVRAAVRTVDEPRRTVEVVFATETPVERIDGLTGERFREVLSTDAAHVRLDRLRNRAPLLDAHMSGSIDNIIGVVERAWLHAGQALAAVRFSKREAVDPIWL